MGAGGRPARLPGDQASPIRGTRRAGRSVHTETRELCNEAGDEVSKRLKTECPDL